MQELYGSDGTNYRVLAKSENFSDKIDTRLRNISGFCRYDINKGNARSEKPGNIVYISSSLNNTFPSVCPIICYNSVMKKYASVEATYFHAVIFDGDFDYKNCFQELFHLRFIGDDEAHLYTSQTLSEKAAYGDYSDELTPISVETVKSIVKLMLERDFDKRKEKIRLVMDVCGAGYDARCMVLLSKVYHYLPYTLRRKYGFSTYSNQTEPQVHPQTAIVLYERDFAGANNTFVWLSELQAGGTVTVSERISKLVDQIFASDQDEMLEQFDELEKKIGSHAEIESILDFFDYAERWNCLAEQGYTEELFDAVLDYLLDPTKEHIDPLYQIKCDTIRQLLPEKMWQTQLKEQVLGAQYFLSAMPKGVLELVEAMCALGFWKEKEEQELQEVMQKTLDDWRQRVDLRRNISEFETIEEVSGYKEHLTKLVDELDTEISKCEKKRYGVESLSELRKAWLQRLADELDDIGRKKQSCQEREDYLKHREDVENEKRQIEGAFEDLLETKALTSRERKQKTGYIKETAQPGKVIKEMDYSTMLERAIQIKQQIRYDENKNFCNTCINRLYDKKIHSVLTAEDVVYRFNEADLDIIERWMNVLEVSDEDKFKCLKGLSELRDKIRMEESKLKEGQKVVLVPSSERRTNSISKEGQQRVWSQAGCLSADGGNNTAAISQTVEISSKNILKNYVQLCQLGREKKACRLILACEEASGPETVTLPPELDAYAFDVLNVLIDPERLLRARKKSEETKKNFLAALYTCRNENKFFLMMLKLTLQPEKMLQVLLECNIFDDWDVKHLTEAANIISSRACEREKCLNDILMQKKQLENIETVYEKMKKESDFWKTTLQSSKQREKYYKELSEKMERKWGR